MSSPPPWAPPLNGTRAVTRGPAEVLLHGEVANHVLAMIETQSFLYRAAKAVTAVVQTERLYLLSLASNQGNAHVYWHIDPLPPGVPMEKQQLRALLAETHGFLDVRFETRRAWRDAIAAKLEEGADWEQRELS